MLNAFDERGKIDIVGVHLVDDDDPTQAQLAGFAKHAPRVDFDARVGVDHDHGRFDGVEGADGLADEVGVAGRIEH